MAGAEIATIREVFRGAPFVAELGMELESVGAGECVTVLKIEQRHLQQNGYVHAGVVTTVADHTAGAAASTLVPPGFYILTAEIKASFLRAAKGERLVCRARVLKPGRQFSFVESEVFCVSAGEERLVSKASATMAVVAASRE